MFSMLWSSFWFTLFGGVGRKFSRHQSSLFYLANFKLEGWLSIPEKKNKRRHDWKRQYVVVSNRKIFFYNTAEDKTASKPSMILDIRYVNGILIVCLTRDSFCNRNPSWVFASDFKVTSIEGNRNFVIIGSCL